MGSEIDIDCSRVPAQISWYACSIYWGEAWLSLWRMIEAHSIARYLNERLTIGEDVRILECGCSDGRFFDLLAKGIENLGGRGAVQMLDAYGVDNDQTRVFRALQRSTGFTPINGDLGQAPFRSSSFDAVIANSTLEHSRNVDRLISEISRVTKPGGVAVITVPSVDFESELLGVKLRNAFGKHEEACAWAKIKSARISHFHYQAPEWWIEQFREHGFDNFYVRYIVSPAVIAVGDALQWIRDAGIGGSRFSLADPHDHGFTFRIMRRLLVATQFALSRAIRQCPRSVGDEVKCGAYLIGMSSRDEG